MGIEMERERERKREGGVGGEREVQTYRDRKGIKGEDERDGARETE